MLEGIYECVSRTIEDACVTLCSRRIDIAVGDVRYLPMSVLNRKSKSTCYSMI